MYDESEMSDARVIWEYTVEEKNIGRRGYIVRHKVQKVERKSEEEKKTKRAKPYEILN